MDLNLSPLRYLCDDLQTELNKNNFDFIFCPTYLAVKSQKTQCGLSLTFIF